MTSRTALLITLAALLALPVHAQDNAPRILAELEASYPAPPPGKNAASLFQEGASLLVTDVKEFYLIPEVGEGLLKGNQPIPLTISNALAAAVETNASVLPFFRKASLLEKSQYPIEWSKGYYAMLPHLHETCRRVGYFLRWCSFRYAVQGKGEQAAESILLGLHLARSLEEEPILISQAVRVRCIHEALEGLQQTVNRVLLSGESLELLEKSIVEMELREAAGIPFSRGIAAEKIFAASFCDSPLTNQSQLLTNFNFGQKLGEKALQIILARDAKIERQFLLETVNEIQRIWAMPYPERLKAAKYCGLRHEEAVKRELMLSSIFLDGTSNYSLNAEAKSLIRLRLAMIAVALERYRLDHYKLYPPFLSHLTPKYLKTVPLDPFDGKPLRYLKVGRGYKAYSLAGTNLNSRTWRSNDDMSFTVSAGPQ